MGRLALGSALLTEHLRVGAGSLAEDGQAVAPAVEAAFPHFVLVADVDVGAADCAPSQEGTRELASVHHVPPSFSRVYQRLPGRLKETFRLGLMPGPVLGPAEGR